ncbi:hypothetical protein [Flavobacterium wongokense]|uniref:hypothetical protein n=1 Tax=Flavobacterium wongokense TaxID=2910674 RepID=UPI001F2252F2|nr:hypothetical protein [Flavobacterium sp. WG47]MCF6132514.1 hypothetical protein [Flavobacterium sp. WG47]
MKEKILIHAVISFVILNIWTLYLFFDYYSEKDGIMHGLGLFLNFIYSVLFGVVLGGILLLIRLAFHFQKKSNPLQTNFLYLLCAMFNFNVFIIWLTSMSLHMIEVGSGRLEIFAFCSLLLSIIIFSDIYLHTFRTKNKIVTN